MWRERDRRVHELVDASPMPSWVYVVSKTLAMALVLVAMLLTGVLASVIVQLSLGFTDLEPGKYLLWYVLPGTWDVLLLAALAVFVQALSPHKAVGWGVMVLFLAWQQLNTAVDHNLLLYGGTPRVPLSDMNGAGSFWKGAWTFRVYWGAFALLLLVAAHLLWRRGAEVRLKPRLAHARRRLAGAPGRVAGAALLAFVAAGGYAYYNTNVLNVYRTQGASEEHAAAYERKYGRYAALPQPRIAALTLDVALHPEERRAVTRGRLRLRNFTAQPDPGHPRPRAGRRPGAHPRRRSPARGWSPTTPASAIASTAWTGRCSRGRSASWTSRRGSGSAASATSRRTPGSSRTAPS